MKSSIVGIEAKASFIEREEKRLIELEAGSERAELVLKERLESLDGKRVLRAKMKAELLQNTDTSARMDTKVSMDELEKKELELLRKVASACKQNGVGEAEHEVKRQFCELESIQATLASTRQKLHTAAMDTSGTQQETRSPGGNTNSLFVVTWSVAGIAEKDTNSFFDHVE